MAHSNLARYRVTSGRAVDLAKRPTAEDGKPHDKEALKQRTDEDAKALNDLQDRLYAEGNRALLVILQGMDCSGKDGVVRAVFNPCGPIGVSVTPFKAPSPVERAHDYLWRAHKACPERGFIGIFNRSHYEDVLVVKVKKLAPADAIERRYAEINAFEKMLTDNGTTILKFMLHISKEEQKKRLTERVEDPEKRWKFNPADLEDRKLWKPFQEAYATMLARCSTKAAPWHVIPADRNWPRNALIARIVRTTLEEMNPRYPAPTGWDPKTIRIV
jgi:PPK2 family polyphosphate:nucleotide phosphotransferase